MTPSLNADTNGQKGNGIKLQECKEAEHQIHLMRTRKATKVGTKVTWPILR